LIVKLPNHNSFKISGFINYYANLDKLLKFRKSLSYFEHGFSDFGTITDW
jgi:hypothetical protein